MCLEALVLPFGNSLSCFLSKLNGVMFRHPLQMNYEFGANPGGFDKSDGAEGGSLDASFVVALKPTTTRPMEEISLRPQNGRET